MKKKLRKMLAAKKTQRAELIARSKRSEDLDELKDINEQLEEVNVEIEKIQELIEEVVDQEPTGEEEGREEEGDEEDETDKEKDKDESSSKRTKEMKKQMEKREARGGQQYKPGSGFVPIETNNREQEREDRAKRGKELKEGRSITVGASSVVVPIHDADNINPTFNKISSLVDGVDRLVVAGGESFKQPYEKDIPAGDYTTEGADYSEADAVFGYADINKSKVTAYSEITEEIQKLPAADYEGVVMNGITKSVRRKLAREILIGSGATNHLTGIFSAQATAIEASTDIEFDAIDNNTLDEIIFSYGGDEDVEDQAVLVLNKIDLKAFSQLRTADGKKFHSIVTNGNTGTIDGIPFIINSACKAITATATAAGEYCMAYGPLSNYKMVVFSELEVMRSTDYRFKQGMVAHKGSIFVGGNVVSYNGFLRVKKSV